MKKFIYGLLLTVTIYLTVSANDQESKKCFILAHGLPTYDSIDLKRIHEGECIHLAPILMTCFPSELSLKMEPTRTTVFNKSGEIIFDTYTTDSVWFCVKDSLCPIEPNTYFYQMEFPRDTFSQQSINIKGVLNIIEK